MKHAPTSEEKGSPFIVIFTDLDGTLLDHDTYEWESAKPALKRCKHVGIPIIPVSSKTRAEIEAFQEASGLYAPFVSENGGGVYFPKHNYPERPEGAVSDENLWRWSLGLPYDVLVNALEEIRDELGWVIQGFSDMTPQDISNHTGLDPEAARLAALRDYDEPFIIIEPAQEDVTALEEAAEQRGLYITKGGRFYHIHGKKDKGEAVKRIILWYKVSEPKLKSIALGDSPTDFSMLEQVDYPVLVRSAVNYSGLKDRMADLIITEEKGPAGWNSAVIDILDQIMSGGMP